MWFPLVNHMMLFGKNALQSHYQIHMISGYNTEMIIPTILTDINNLTKSVLLLAYIGRLQFSLTEYFLESKRSRDNARPNRKFKSGPNH